MRTLTALLLLVGLAMAIPLRKGASWQWRILDPSTGALSTGVAKVSDSTKNDSGSIWTLLIGDSAKQATWDTASIVVRKDGSQRWWQATRILPWDPEPWDGQSLQSTHTGWGMAWAMAYGYGDPYSIQLASKAWSWPLMQVHGSEALVTYSLPVQELDSIVGWSRGKFGEAEWIQSSKDGHSLPTSSRDTLRRMRLPGVESTWLWELRTIDSSRSPLSSTPFQLDTTIYTFHTVQWKFNAKPSDSAGWARATVAASWDPGTSSSRDTLLHLRWNPLTGQRGSASPTFDPGLSDGFWEAWWDSVEGSGRSRGTYLYKQPTVGTKNRTSTFQRILPAGGIDSSMSETHSEIYNYFSDKKTSIRLLEHDGTIVRSRTVGIASRSGKVLVPRLGTIEDLRQELSPGSHASIRIADLAGRSRTFAAAEALPALQASHGIVFVELRDGPFFATGRILIP